MAWATRSSLLTLASLPCENRETRWRQLRPPTNLLMRWSHCSPPHHSRLDPKLPATMEPTLRCNRQAGRYCRAPLTDRAVVTTCLFVFSSSWLRIAEFAAAISFVSIVQTNSALQMLQSTIANVLLVNPFSPTQTMLWLPLLSRLKITKRVCWVVSIRTQSWSVLEEH